MAVKTYNAADVSIIFGTRQLTGLAEGSFVVVTRDEQTFTKKVGADGEVTRSKTNNKAGSVVLTLDQSSDSNDFLSESHNIDENTGLGIKPLNIVDGSGTTVVFAREAWVQKPADMDKGRDSGENAWTLDTGPMDVFIGGN